MAEYTIESNIPIPPQTRRSEWKEQFEPMQVNQSFAFPSKRLSSVCQAAARMNIKIVTRLERDKDGKVVAGMHRVWRIG